MRVGILTYHSLDQTGSPVSIAPGTFDRHMGRLRDAGYVVVPLSRALAMQSSSSLNPDRTGPRVAALTFDDAYGSVYHVAAPVLARYGWQATVFAVSDYLDGDNQWPGQANFVPAARLLSWVQLKELSDAGWEIGAHTRTHPDLTHLSDSGLEDEVAGSKHALEQRLGRAVAVFAYPSGRYDERVRRVVRRHFRAACTTNMGWASASSPSDALERIEMWDFARPGAHRLVGSPLMTPYMVACHAARVVLELSGRH